MKPEAEELERPQSHTCSFVLEPSPVAGEALLYFSVGQPRLGACPVELATVRA